MIVNKLKLTFLALVSLSLVSCASIRPSKSSLDLLTQALTAPVIELEAQSNKGGGRSQYALGTVYQYGLRGQSKDLAKANDLKRKAMAMRGYTPITQYIAGLNGTLSRTYIINIPRYEVSPYEAQASEKCASALEARLKCPSSKKMGQSEG
jgi:hypothetical protein